MTDRVLDNLLREKWTKFIFEVLESNGEDMGYIKDNIINFPVLDDEGNEKSVEITIKVPKGSRKDNEPYDLYGLREAYEIDKKNKAIKQAKKEKEKQAKIARDKAFREKQKALREKEKEGK